MADLHSIDSTIPLNLPYGFDASISAQANPGDLREAAREMLAAGCRVLYTETPDEGLTLESDDRAALWATLKSADGLLRAADELTKVQAGTE